MPPSLYKAEYDEKAAELIRKYHATNRLLAGHFGVDPSTITEWLSAIPSFRSAVLQAREFQDSRVTRSIYERAKGYKHKAVKIFRDSKTGEVVSVPYTEHYPPDTEAAKTWLFNRQPAEWRNKQEIEHTGNSQPAIGADEAARLIAFTFAAALQQGGKPPAIELDATAIEQPRPNPFAD